MAQSSDMTILTQPTHQGGRVGREERRAKRTEFFNRFRVRRELDLARRNTRLREKESAQNKALSEQQIQANIEARKDAAKGAQISGIAQTATAIPQSYMMYKMMTGESGTAAAATKALTAENIAALKAKGITPGTTLTAEQATASGFQPGQAVSATPSGEMMATGGFMQPSGAAATAGRTGGIYTAGAYAVPFAAGYGVSRMVGGANKETKLGVGFAAGAAAGAVYGSYAGPYGMVGGAIIGGIMGAAGASCIIVTACTNPYSYEVSITRKYRDKFLDSSTLRGYYMIAEIVVPLIKRYPLFKKLIKSCLVDKLVNYGECKLEVKGSRLKLASAIVSISFLSICKIVGFTRKAFVRSNLEVI